MGKELELVMWLFWQQSGDDVERSIFGPNQRLSIVREEKRQVVRQTW